MQHHWTLMAVFTLVSLGCGDAAHSDDEYHVECVCQRSGNFIEAYTEQAPWDVHNGHVPSGTITVYASQICSHSDTVCAPPDKMLTGTIKFIFGTMTATDLPYYGWVIRGNQVQ